MTPGDLSTYPDRLDVTLVVHYFGRSKWADEQLRAGRLPYLRLGKQRIIGREMLRRVLSGELVRREGEWVEARELLSPVSRGEQGGKGNP